MIFKFFEMGKTKYAGYYWKIYSNHNLHIRKKNIRTISVCEQIRSGLYFFPTAILYNESPMITKNTNPMI
ncbi:hypothetical protein SAMN05421813_12941 [Daejeonella rubra]|uniref:Uncharacterized protein n=1 Tax=Daejeonella rubra TaxID=990371 RepID=A0A1G9X9V7_9SPHI|nr:hypothetical protein SAMN05421813_12941 [Daejeonella rubra]